MDRTTADEIKLQGNAYFKTGNYVGALERYTTAIDLNPKDSTLYSNRSFVHLKMRNYYYANRDADVAIELNQSWPKAHYRKAEVLAEVGQYDSALLSYGRALALKPDDYTILTAAQKVAKFSNEQSQYEKRLPWVGAGIGIIIGIIISLADSLLTKKPSIKHPVLMVLLVIIIASIGYALAKLYRYYQRVRKKSLLDPKIDPEMENKTECNNVIEAEKGIESEIQHSYRNRYTRSQARLRFKKGKF